MRHRLQAVVFKLADHFFSDFDDPLLNVPETFLELLHLWKHRHVRDLSINTRVRYKTLEESFGFFHEHQVQAIRSQHIDLWLEIMIRQSEERKGRRESFLYELRVLKSIFHFFKETFENVRFDIPIRERHFQRAVLPHRIKKARSKNLTHQQFKIFRQKLSRSQEEQPYNGKILAQLATIHFFHALRISEVAAIHWEDIHLNTRSPSASFLRIQRSFKWLKAQEAKLEAGFKNSNATDGVKDLPLFRETYRIFRAMKRERMRQGKPLTGLIFHNENGKPFSYRVIQYAYDCAFKKAGLDYSGTHILRHGGCRRLYRKTKNLETAQQLLGNTNIKNTIVYTETKGEALATAVRREWKSKRGSS